MATKLTNLYKGRGDMQDPNNWRDICLKEMSVEIASMIIANRLLSRLKDIGISYQFPNKPYIA